MNGAYGEGLLAFDHAREMVWRMIELGAWMFIGAAALYFIVRAFRT